ncbi:MAG: CPBP family intramembrane metalloprotease [Bacilli bacterium]|nr:CPBP family intramembrane metalloprotease [Bacilli bacterium]
MSESKKSNEFFKDSSVYRFIVFLVGFLAFFIISFIVSLVVSVILGQPADDDLPAKVKLLAYSNAFTYYALFIVLLIVLIPAFGYLIKCFAKIKNVLIGLGIGALIIGVTLLYSLIIEKAFGVGDNNNQIIAVRLIKDYPWVGLTAISFIGPFTEEITYRFGLFDLCKRKNVILAYIVSSLVFGLIHFDFTSSTMNIELLNLPSYIICGLGLAFAYDKFGFGASFSAHMINNLYSTIMILLGSYK